MVRTAAVVQQVPDSAPGAKAASKAIFLFSDGTGNSSAKLFKTNVWRLYETLDLGPAPPGEQVQIAFYDNGVGTSAFRPLRWLGGIFGLGLKRNVLRLYTFLCRNYRKGDRIYAFGFSRGAFTIRILAALIAKQGVLVDEDDADLAHLVHDAYRAYCRDRFPPRWRWKKLAGALHRIRDEYLGLKRRIRTQRPYSSANREHPDIDFVGVWDTVAAYGGPFAELTRGFNDWVWPLSLPNYRLSPRVKVARHALSLDDERDAFWPLLWDEEAEAGMIADGVKPGRLEQVWFAGVHSDVGGGYPDESLSFTSLVWMMDELIESQQHRPKSEQPRFIGQIAGRTAAMANALGPIHDSRAGAAAYYRYQPRKITAFLKAFRSTTISMRDPQSPSFLNQVLVHESVLARIISGVDNYAPAALPAEFKPVLATGPYGRRLLTATQLKHLERTQAERNCRFESQENQWDKVWWRRATYFLTVFATLLLLTLPSLPWLGWLDDMCSDDRCFAQDISRTVLFFLPESYRGWLTPWAERPIATVVMLVAITALIWSGRRSERSFRDLVRKSWDKFRTGKLKAVPSESPSPLRKWREGATYQSLLRILKWHVLPLVFGIAALLAIVYGAVVVVTQSLYALAEPQELFCSDDPAGATAELKLDAACTNLGISVRRAQSYRVTIRVTKPWMDDFVPADPKAGASHESVGMMLGRPLKRVTHARWLQPVSEVRADQTGALRYFQWLVGKDIELRRLRFVRQADGSYVSDDLCPRRSGQLHMMINDAAPLLVPWPYWNNTGAATVAVSANGKACGPGRR